MNSARAAVLRAFHEPLDVTQVAIPRIVEGEVLVQLLASGVCGSDVHMWRGEDPRTPLPITLGHEGVGRVVDVRGDRRTVEGHRLSPGDIVIWNRGVVCGRCYWCTVARTPALCPNRWAYGIHRSFDHGAHLNGCYADHVLLHPDTDILLAPAGISPAILVAASCSGLQLPMPLICARAIREISSWCREWVRWEPMRWPLPVRWERRVSS